MTPRPPAVSRWLAFVLFLVAAVGAAHAQIAISSSTLVRIYLSTTIKDLTLTNAGSGYTAAPTVAITGGGGSGATATATVANGKVTGFTITNAGSGYTSLPTVTLSGGGGTGAAARVVFRSIPSAVSPGTSTPQFAGAFAHSGGAAAKNVGTPSATFSVRYPAQKYLLSGTSQPSGVVVVFMRSTIGSSFAAGVPRYNFGDVISPPATDAGGIITAAAGYWRPQPVGVGETFTQTSNPTNYTPIPLVVAAVKVTAGGNSYTSAPTVVFSGGGGSGAAATAVLTQGIVTGVTMTSAGSGYSSLPGIAFSGGGGSGAMAVAESQVVPFYYSPHAQKVFASNAGRVTMTWVTGVPVATPTDPALLYRYKEEIFSVSSGSSLPIRKIFWSERSFTGPSVAVPSGKIETINPVYSANFPATVAQEYQAVGVTAPVMESAALPSERRTFWFDKIAGIGQLHAYNLEGRILIEYLGALKADGGGVHEFLGADIVDVVRVPEPITTTVVLGEQLTPRDEDNQLLPLDLSSEWIPSPVQSASSDTQAYYGTITRKDSKRVYYAERENLNAERVAFYWLEQNDAAIHFLTSPAKPELGILWPKIKSHYLQVWPSDLASFAHNTTPTGGSTAAAGVRFPGGQVPQIIFQDDVAQTEATVDTSTQSLLVTSPWDGLSRTLLKFTAANEVWYVRLYTQNAARPGFQEGDSLSAINVAATVGTRIDAPGGHEVGGYIASGTGYLPSAYRDPFSVGMETAAKGAIIPVNAVPGNNTLQVWWFKKVVPASASFQPFYVPAKVGNYTLSYPAVPSTLVLASNAGTGDLTSAEIAGSLYVQNERSLPGFNPNEEHAVMLGGRAYALRDDLNNTTAEATAYTSQPFVLLAYTSAIDGRPAMRAWKVLREVDEAGDATDLRFKYPVTAGTILQAPMPLPLLPLPIDPATNKVKNKEVAGIADSTPNGTAPAHYASFTFKDRKGYDWVYRGPHGGMPVNAISLVSLGAGYTSVPTVALSGGGGAAATATLSGGKITAITLTNSGSGYTSAPTVTLTGGGYTGLATAVAAVGPTLGMQYYYALQAGFYLPGLVTQPAVGTILPYLRPLVGGVPQGDAVTGTPLTIVYTPVWPSTAAELRIAETLTLPKYGLPAVMNQRSAHVLYEQSVALQGTTKASVSLFDPLREKTFALGAAGKLASLPTSILSSTSQGKTYFQGLPPHLQSRFYYDPTYGTTGALVLKGTFVDEVAGEDVLYLNVLSTDDVTALNALPSSTDANCQLWLSAISELSTKVETFVQDPNKAGSFIANTTPVTVSGTALATVTNADTAVVNYALTATGLASGWVTMIFGNGLAFTPTGEPVSVQVIKVAPTLNTGELKQLYSSNPLDEQVSLRHSADFAGNPGAYDFEWRYAPPQNGVAPSTYTYTYTSRFGSSWNVAQNPAAALPTSTEYLAATTATLPRNVTIKNATYSGDPARPGLVVRSAAGVDFTTGVPVSIIFSADLSDPYAGFVLYINGAAALAYNAPAAFSSTLASSGLVPAGVSPAGLARQFAIEGNYFKAAVNTIEVAVFSTGDALLSSNLNFSLHASAETDMVAAVGSPWQTPNGTLSNQVVVGGSATSPLGSPLLVMSDNYFTMRYRPKINTGNILATGTSQAAVAWSRWMPPKLVEGWIKRVLAGINPFNQRVTDLYNNSVNTDVSLLTQAGKRWEGNVPLSLANIDSFGLIEIYETVLNRGKTISIDSGYDYAPANDALLLAAGYLNDLYTLLGNEAYADAANPTISVDGGSTSTEVNTSRFAFESQVKSVLDEELALLRGRDDFLAPGIAVTPAYNRLYWNFTRGINSGEALYAANYNIREKSGSPTSDGKIDAADAQRMFPQGHGDAYGHYLTALKGYTRLLQSSNFTWTPRSEAVTVLGQTVQVDYFDERKFATAAVNIARTAQQVIALTHRQSYTDDTAAGWTHLSDGKYNASTRVTRHWGTVEWSARATQGAYYNWLIGNSILPDKDLNPQNNGVQVVDRTTVPELPELTTLGEALQSKVDSINARLNPLSLSPNAVAFDISPTELKAGKSHFDQIYERSLQAVTNAKGAFDQAARMTRLLRNQENQVSDTTSAIVDQENAYARRLIDLYGTPYPFEIGAGKVYAQDYAGPDLLEWFIIDRPHDSSGGLINSATTLTLSLKVPTEVATFTGFALEDITKHYEEKYTTRSITIDPAKSVQYSDVWAGGAAMGQRSVTGRLQQALADGDQARMALQLAADGVQNSYESFKRRRELAVAMVQAHTDSVAESDASGKKIEQLRKTQVALELSAQVLHYLGDGAFNLGVALSEMPPKAMGIGSNDVTSPVRSGLVLAGTLAKTAIDLVAFAFEAPAKQLEIEQENLEGAMQDAIAEFAFSYEQAQVVYEYELAMRELSTGFYQVAMHANTLQRANENARNLQAEGLALQAERETFRQRAAAKIQGYRTNDITFRTFRNEALEQYRSLYDLASRYTYLAAKAYDYETGLLGSTAGKSVINAIVASRSLGDLTGGIPQATVSTFGDSGLAGTMARLQADWAVAKPRLGINSPDQNGTLFSLRRELYRLVDGTGGDPAWQQTLEQNIMSNIMADADVAAACRNLRNADGSAVPGIVIAFSTVVQDKLNFFGRPLTASDHTFSPSNFATKIYSAGIVFPGYVGMDPYRVGVVNAGSPSYSAANALSATPYVYLIPTGADYMLAPPLGDVGTVREFKVSDQALPLPFNLGATAFSSVQYFDANGTLSEQPWVLRKHQAFRPVNDAAFFFSSVPAEFTNNRLVGRSVWNSGWKIVIPAKTLSSSTDALNRFVASVKDIELFLRTYSHAGN